jgi:serine/threonine protein kinase/formylglycine-generating enzyme required for sulfatase activity
MRERSIFQKAIEIADPVAREAFVRKECGDDQELFRRVMRLLRAAVDMGDFLASPALGDEPGQGEMVGATHAESPFVGEETIDLGSERDRAIGQLKPYLAPSDDASVIGRLGHYEIEQFLGRGAFGIVLAGRDLKLNRPVAIKVLAPELASTSPPRKRFLREARAAGSIRHQNVVSVYAVEEEPIPYLVMERIDGATLQDWIDQRGPLEVHEVIRFGGQLLAGLAAAHAVGVVHRDIKPSNLLIEGEAGQLLKISDFGLARTVDDASLTQTGFTAGTPLYMSPEQAQGKTVDARSDLFSVASTLYAISTGRPPFRARSTLAVLKRVAEETPRPIAEIVPEVPEWIRVIIRKLHGKLPEDRFESAQPAFELWQACEEEWRLTGTISPQLRERLGLMGDAEPMRKVGSEPERPVGVGEFEPVAGPSTSWQEVVWAGAMFAVLLGMAFLIYQWYGVRRVTFESVPPMEVDPLPSVGPALASGGAVSGDATAAGSESREPVVASIPVSGFRGTWGADAPPFAQVPVAADEAQELARLWGDHLGVPVEWTHPLGLRFRLIPPGEFVMGTDANRAQALMPQIVLEERSRECLKSESPRHRVVLTQPYYLSVHEVTQNQFESLMGRNPSYYQPGVAGAEELPPETGLLPVEKVTWFDAAEFCRKLSRREDLACPYEIVDGTPAVNPAAIGYRLPTEAEWEYACLAGSEGPYATGGDENALVAMANFGGRLTRPMPVGSLAANAFGIYDMHGNVNEWVEDVWEPNGYAMWEGGPAIDPRSTQKQGLRVSRGGDFFYGAVDVRAAARYAWDADVTPRYALGFRVAVPVAVKRGFTEAVPATSNVLAGATAERLVEWAKGLGREQIPVSINPRHGVRPVLFDAIAVPNEEKVAWESHLIEDSEGDYQAMRGTHRPTMRIPVAGPPGTPMKTLFLWAEGSSSRWYTWEGTRGFIQGHATDAGAEGFVPVSIFGFAEEGLETWVATKAPIPGAETRLFFDIDEAELAQRIEEFRARGWRPIRLMQHTGFETPRFAVVFRDNPNGWKWGYEAGLSEADYAAKVEENRGRGMVPVLLAASQQEDGVVYRVVWSEGRRD